MTHRRWWKRLVAGLLLPLLVGVGLAQALDARRFIEVYGSGGWTRVQQWQQLLTRLESVPVRRQLREVNDFFNRLRFTDDISVWGKEDYWLRRRSFWELVPVIAMTLRWRNT
ncbi:hypothetical protein [Cobetia crustatorum]|uniref:hypothetical protein n=1 Tax=Cobetia crustatorum TaxID=553385 RepID=UPI0004B8128F|nr:hypothetical protein [Cobetia crustatorum]